MFWILIEELAGIALLYYGAEFLVKGGVAIAVRLGIPPLIVGLTLVSFATSAPELVVSIKAALAGNGAISIGNVVGSNICNLGLILGLSAAIAPLAVSRQLLKFDVPVLIALSVLFAGIGLGFTGFGRLSGILFLALLVGYMAWNIHSARKNGGKADPEILENTLKVPAAFGLTVIGIGALVGGGHFLVEGAVALGQRAGISDAVIGLTIVAIGTSLPELATSVIAAIRKQQDIAIGNVIGSNILNILVIMGISPILRPVSAANIAVADWVVMAGLPLVLYPVMCRNSRVGRMTGIALLGIFILYMIWLVCNASGN